MATAYTSLLGLALPVTGELQGTWGTTVNDAITSLLDTAVAGTTTLNTDSDVTLSTTTGAANQARQAIILWTANGTVTRNITAPAQSKVYVVINASAGTQDIVIRGVGPTTGVTVAKGEKVVVAWNGSDFVRIASYGGTGEFTTVDTTNLEVTNIKAKDGTAAATIADSTGVVTVSQAPVMSALTASQAVFTTAGKALVSNPITGTGNVVMSGSPTLTGTVAGASLQLSSLTSGRVTYAGASGLLQDSANLTFNGTDLTVSGAVNAGTVNATTFDMTNLEVTNIKAKDGTAAASIADSTGIITVSTQLNVDNLNLSGNTLSSTDANGNIVLAPNGTGDVQLDADTVRIGDANANATLTTNGTGDLILNTNAGTNSGSITIADAANGDISLAPNGNGSVVITNAGTSNALRITQTGSGNALLVEDSANPDATPFVIDKDGYVISGHTSVVLTGSLIQTVSTVAQAFGAINYSNDTNGPVNNFVKARGTISSPVVVQSGDTLSRFDFLGYDGAANVIGARIFAAVDGTPGTNDMPGRLVFSTTADGASTPTERMRIDSAGNVGIGTTAVAGQTLRVAKTITGNVSAYGMLNNGTVQSDVTSDATMYRSTPSTAAASFTLPNLYNFSATQGSFGAGSTVTNQFGFYAESNLTGATNNYGFYSNIASGTGRWNFYANGTADNYFAGRVGVGSVPFDGIGSVYANRSITGNAFSYGVLSSGTVQSDVTSHAYYFRSTAATQATSFTAGALSHFAAEQGTFGAGSTVTNQYGHSVGSSLTGATNNYGFYSNIASGTGRWNFYANGTADNFFGGPTTISVNSTSNALRITQTGAGNALVVEDSANPDATPFVVNATGKVGIGLSSDYTNAKLQIFAADADAQLLTARGTADGSGFIHKFYKTRSTNIYAQSIVSVNDIFGILQFTGDDGVQGIVGAQISAAVDGTPGTNDMPGRLVFSTTADGASTPTERMRIDSAGNVGVGGIATTVSLYNVKNITGGAFAYAFSASNTIQSDVTSTAAGYHTALSTADAVFTLSNLRHFWANQGTVTGGSRTAPTNQFGFSAASSLTGATNNYGFYSDIASGTGRWNFYANGTAQNYFAGNTLIGTTTNTNSSALVVNGSISETVSSVQYLVASQYDVGTDPNEIPVNGYLGALAFMDSQFQQLAVGTGITGGTGTICKTSSGMEGGVSVTRVLIDLTGLNSGGTAGDIIGVNGTANPCYILALPSVTVLGGRMTCLEAPAGGDTDIDLYSATEGTGVEDQAITALTETQLINGGVQALGTVTYFAADPTFNGYLYLVGQGTANATYTAGRFLIEIFGVQP